jgi:glycosyltransferase involved in cell wall biosynthesis
MNVIVIIHNQVGSGPYKKILEMCEALSLNDTHVTLLCTSKTNKLLLKKKKINNLLVVESPDLFTGKLRQGLDIWNIINRLLFVSKNNYDIVHGIDCRPVVILPALLLKYFKKTKFILSWWDLFGSDGTALERSGNLYNKTFGKIETLIEEYFRRFADSATVVSDFLKIKLETLGYPSSKIELHRIGCNLIDLRNFDKIQIRREYNFNESEVFLCFVGNLFEKDKNLLIASLRKLKGKNSNLPHTIIIGNSQIEFEICKELSINILGRIESIDDLNKIMYSCDYSLIPMQINNANIARWPSKIADYWSVGLPVIATPISDYPKLFSEYELGFLSKSDSPEDYSDAINMAIHTTKNDYQKKQDAIANFVKNELNWTILSKKLSNLYMKNL